MTGLHRVPLEPDLFRADGDRPVLLGSRCSSCDEAFFPRRWICPVCLDPVNDIELSQSGTLYSYAFISAPIWGKVWLDSTGYGVGQVDLPEGVRVQTVLEGLPDEWDIGAAMSLTYTTVESVETGDSVVVLYSFARSQA